jgi:hypothetical protein
MKTNRLINGARIIAMLALITQAAPAADIPRGTLNVDRTLVQAGTRSNLDWEITYPGTVADLVDIKDTGSITLKADYRMKVRVLGVAFQSGKTLLPLDGYWSLNKFAWKPLFYGTGPQVLPTKVLVDVNLKKDDTINFGARGWNGSSWLPFHSTLFKDKYVTVLKNGDSAPSYAPAYDQASAQSFLAPFLDGSGKIKIGSRDLIVLWEASTALPGTTYFDMQDLVVLVTFE